MGLCWCVGKLVFLSKSSSIYYNQYFQNKGKKEILSGAMVIVMLYVLYVLINTLLENKCV